MTDTNADGVVDIEALYALTTNPIDINADGTADESDVNCLNAWLRRNEAE